MKQQSVFKNWGEVLDAPGSKFFKGHTADTVYDMKTNPRPFIPAEALFTQSNTRVLLGQAANGSLRFISIPTQVYPAPTSVGELNFCPGMYHYTDLAMYVGDLSYSIELESGKPIIDLSAGNRDNETVYADHFLPLTRTRESGLRISVASLAPVASDPVKAPLSPAPLPGPAGCIYALRLKNEGNTALEGKVILKASDMLIGRYEDMRPEMRSFKRPAIDMRQQTLILYRPEGAVGIHLHRGSWRKTDGMFEAERQFAITPGEEIIFETHIAIGAGYKDIMPVIYELHMRSMLDWLNLTACFWRSRLGRLKVDAKEASEEAYASLDIHIRSQLDNFNCLQTDANGNLLSHLQGAPSHGFGTIWGIDVEPTAVSIVNICPELTRQVMLFFLNRSRVSIYDSSQDHSVPILIAPVIVARKWLQVTGDTSFFDKNPKVLADLIEIVDDLVKLKAPNETLFPTRYSSDGPVGRKYDYGTNVKVWYALESMAYILEHCGHSEQAAGYRDISEKLRLSVERTMIVQGPFGRQISGGTNLGGDPGTFYIPEDICYYDGEDTSSMLAPVYGYCNFTDEAWINYHRFARSLFCYNYDPEFDTLLWGPAEPAAADGTALVSRVGGSVTRHEMKEAFGILKRIGIDDVNGSLYWWPSGYTEKRTITRCSQGQGAWAWQYMQQWLGISIDSNEHVLTFAPQGLLTDIKWEGFRGPGYQFDIDYSESGEGSFLKIKNTGNCKWLIRAGFRQVGAGTEGGLAWEEGILEAGREYEFNCRVKPEPLPQPFTRKDLIKVEKQAMADAEGVIFKRYGPVYFFNELSADLSTAPLQMRFVVANGTEEDWNDVSVRLDMPEAWMGKGRAPGYMTLKGMPNMSRRTTEVQLGGLQAGERTVAAFSLKRPNRYQFVNNQAFHIPSQPDNSINLYTNELDLPEIYNFNAVLTAQTSAGRNTRKELKIPVSFLPVK